MLKRMICLFVEYFKLFLLIKEKNIPLVYRLTVTDLSAACTWVKTLNGLYKWTNHLVSLSQDYSKVSCISHLLLLVFLPFLETVDLFFFSHRSVFKQFRLDMDSSEAGLDRIESQMSTDVSHNQRNRRYFLMNLMNNGANRICSRGSPESRRACTQPPKGDKEFLTSLRLSDLYNLPGESVAMNSEILSAMRTGNIEFLEKMKRFETPMACFKNNKGDSILHLAASYGHLELAKGIVSACPSLLLEPNWEDRVPLHVAARAGRSAVVEALVASVTYFSAGQSKEERERLLNLYVLKDKDGDTPLHLALKDLHEKTEVLNLRHSLLLSS